MQGEELSPEQYDASAKQAAAAGDPEAMVAGLYKGRLLAALRRDHAARWRHLSADDVEDAIAHAVDAAYWKILNGGKINDLFGYIYKVVKHECQKVNIRRSSQVDFDASRHGRSYRDADSEEEKEAEDRRRAEAMAAVRRLIGRISGTNMGLVLGYLLDAYDKGEYDVTAAEVGTALGLTPENVRTLKSRGLDRLRDLAADEGLGAIFEDRDLPITEVPQAGAE